MALKKELQRCHKEIEGVVKKTIIKQKGYRYEYRT
jgi:hypothetical protein